MLTKNNCYQQLVDNYGDRQRIICLYKVDYLTLMSFYIPLDFKNTC